MGTDYLKGRCSLAGRVGARGVGFTLGQKVQAVAALAVCLVCVGRALAADAAPSTRPAGSLPVAAASDGNRFPVSKFILQYHSANSSLPTPAELMKIPIKLGRVADGYVVPPA